MNQLESILQEQFLNKIVKVKIAERDNFGKNHLNRVITLIGKCEWIGENKFLNIPIQITIKRMPIEVKHINDIKL